MLMWSEMWLVGWPDWTPWAGPEVREGESEGCTGASGPAEDSERHLTQQHTWWSSRQLQRFNKHQTEQEDSPCPETKDLEKWGMMGTVLRLGRMFFTVVRCAGVGDWAGEMDGLPICGLLCAQRKLNIQMMLHSSHDRITSNINKDVFYKLPLNNYILWTH